MKWHEKIVQKNTFQELITPCYVEFRVKWGHNNNFRLFLNYWRRILASPSLLSLTTTFSLNWIYVNFSHIGEAKEKNERVSELAILGPNQSHMRDAFISHHDVVWI